MCFCGVSLRTATYFWAFMHMFMAMIFLLVCGLETLNYYQFEGAFSYASVSVVVGRSDILMLWSYGAVFLTCCMIIFHAIHKELPALLKWALLLYIVLELCAGGLVKTIIARNSTHESSTEDFLETYFRFFKTSLVVFFITVHILMSFIYSVNLLIYTYILQKSQLILKTVTYV